MKTKYIYWIVIGILAIVFLYLLFHKKPVASPTTIPPGYTDTGTLSPTQTQQPAPDESQTSSLTDLLFNNQMFNFLTQSHTVS